jgi:hypothetical protein
VGWLYGHTGFSFIDVWALVHFAFWIFAGSCAWALVRKSGWRWVWPSTLSACIMLAYSWEVLEAFLAPRYHQAWGDWFLYAGFTYGSACANWIPSCHYESWWNSWVSDPLTCLVGVLLIWVLLNRKPQ